MLITYFNVPITRESRAAPREREELLLQNFAKNLVFASGAHRNQNN